MVCYLFQQIWSSIWSPVCCLEAPTVKTKHKLLKLVCHVWCYCCRAVVFKYTSIKSLVKRQIVTKYLSPPRNQKQCWALLLNTLFLKAELTLEYPEARSKGNKSIRLCLMPLELFLIRFHINYPKSSFSFSYFLIEI